MNTRLYLFLAIGLIIFFAGFFTQKGCNSTDNRVMVKDTLTVIKSDTIWRDSVRLRDVIKYTSIPPNQVTFYLETEKQKLFTQWKKQWEAMNPGFYRDTVFLPIKWKKDLSMPLRLVCYFY